MASLHRRRTPPVASETEAGRRVSYGPDVFSSTQQQARMLRERRFEEPDDPTLLDEVESLGRSVEREIATRRRVLPAHRLTWRYQPERRSRSRKSTIVEQGRRILEELDGSPGLPAYPSAFLSGEYDPARVKAAAETDLPEDAFPPSCPFRLEDVLHPDFHPDVE